MLWSEGNKDENAKEGVALFIKDENMKNLTDQKFVYEIIIYKKMERYKEETHTVVVAYGFNAGGKRTINFPKTYT